MRVVACVLLALSFVVVDGLYIDGCPMFGCRPSGSFSFYSSVPQNNASVNWISDIVLDPVPGVLGCVADSVNVVCQSNGPFAEDKGYVSLYGENGTVRWKDKVLHFPTLPLLDNYGDVTGSDGVRLVHYDLFGKLFPIIKCYGLRPMFSMQLVSNIYLLLVSENGALVVRDVNAIPVATIFLNDTVQRSNGTFLPISQPVVNGSRFYLLTEFVPQDDVYDPKVLNLQRLYAIDIHHRMADIMTIAWSFSFEMEHEHNPDVKHSNHKLSATYDDKLKYEPKTKDRTATNVRENIISKQNIIWDASRASIYVSLPPPYASTNQPSTFWGFRDKGNCTELLFRSYLDVVHMATFEADTDVIGASNDDDKLPLWVTTADNMIHSIKPDGNVSTSIDLKTLLKTDVTITSKLSLVKQNDTSESYLLFAINVSKPTVQFTKILRSLNRVQPSMATSFVVALGTDNSQGTIQWMVPVPDNMVVKGQLTGSSGADMRIKDQLIFYAETSQKTAKIISIH